MGNFPEIQIINILAKGANKFLIKKKTRKTMDWEDCVYEEKGLPLHI